MATQRAKAERLRSLHRRGQPLVLINAWDAASARIVEQLGFPAIATTSAGLAWAEGYADGENISREQMLARVAVVASAVDVPLSADLEGGYGSTVEAAAETARGAIDAGAVGLNFEDASAGSPPLLEDDLQVARIRAMHRVGDELGVPLVINARTDVYLLQIGNDPAWRLAEAVRRANRYIEAGADCIFVPGVVDEQTIAALVKQINGPLNVLDGKGTPNLGVLAELGVARVSVGSGAMGYALAKFREATIAARDTGNLTFSSERMSHAELNALFDRSHAAT